MPQLIPDYRHAWWLPGAHLPTIWGKKVRRQPQVHDRVERWPTPDGDHISIARVGTMAATRPHLLILHGLEGTTHSNYAQGLLNQALVRGWSADLMLFRGCDGDVNSARRMYHSGETSDLDFIVRQLVAFVPDVRLRLVGVSLGGNVLMKWMGEQGESLVSNVVRAAGVSVPFDLAAGSRSLECYLGQKYVDHFTKSLKIKTLAKRSRYPDLCDWDRMLQAKTFWEFDDAVTGPVHGFRNALDYYTQSSSLKVLSSIRRPTLLFSAEDDPFLPAEVLRRVRKLSNDNEFLHTCFTEQGGHVGWTEGQPWSPHYYMEEFVVDWLSKE